MLMGYRGIGNYFAILLIFAALPSGAQVPFHKGVNLTNWFQAASARQMQFTKYTKKRFSKH